MEQVAIFEKSTGFIAYGWNQTSVNGDTWLDAGEELEEEDEEGRIYLPYNLSIHTNHYFLFDE